jgi:hypothetical protein
VLIAKKFVTTFVLKPRVLLGVADDEFANGKGDDKSIADLVEQVTLSAAAAGL